MADSDSERRTPPKPTDVDSTESDAQRNPSSEGSDDSSTKSTSERWWLTNDLLAFTLTFGFFSLVYGAGAGLLTLQTIPELLTGTVAVAFGTSVAWAFGEGALKAWRGGK